MKKKRNTIYLRAVRLFEDGQIDKAIKKCDEGISLNLRDAGTLNLKGLLLYLKGDLNGATATWKVNSDYNDDVTAKNYIIDSKHDKDKLKLYSEGERLLRNLNIDDAINLFEKCSESDFNKINVNLSLANCYYKKADYAATSVYLTRVFEIDKNNKKAIELEKELKKYGGINLQIKMNSINYTRAIAIILLMIFIIGGTIYMYSSRQKKDIISTKANITKKEKKDDSKVIEQKQSGETKKEVLVNTQEIQSAINNKDYNKIYDLIEPLANKKMDSNQQLLYVNAKNMLMSDDAIDYFYTQAMGLYKSSKYPEALSSFQKVHEYGEKNYLYEHSIYFIGATNNKLGNKNETINAFEEYFQKYKDGSYIEEVIYTLALLYKDVDLNKCKTYAEYLVDNYPDSIYNNKNISNLLEQIQ